MQNETSTDDFSDIAMPQSRQSQGRSEKYQIGIPDHADQCARRLRSIIRTRTHKQAEFARLVGMSPTQLNNAAQGVSRLSIEAAIKIVQEMPGLSLDYIYLGVRSGLSVMMAEALSEAETALSRV